MSRRIALTLMATLIAPLASRAESPVFLPGGIKLARIDFERHVMGLIGRLGCNGGACHGSFQGRGGFRLSLFGHDFDTDHEALVDRVDTDDPELSYILEKATLQTEHGGGRRLDVKSWQFELFRSWIAAGAPREAGRGEVCEMAIRPSVLRIQNRGEHAQLKAVATFANGEQEDVTPFCDFHVTTEDVGRVANDGKVTALRPGDTTVVVSYRGHVAAAQLLVPSPVDRDFIYPKIIPHNEIDRLAFLKLRQLNIVPAPLSDDFEFIRRVFIDTIGRLPSPSEVREFVADPHPQKRLKLIDRLLSDPQHAALWATKLSDITGNSTNRLDEPRRRRSQMWHDWLRVRLERNAPYSDIVRGILTATSRDGREPQDWVRDAREIDEAALIGFDADYAKRETLDLYWLRRNTDIEQLGEQTAVAFLGVRLTCAKCHKHPYDRWTQQDYRAFANVFGHVRVGTSTAVDAALRAENERRNAITDNRRKLPALREVFVDLTSAVRLRDPRTNQPLQPAALGGAEFTSDSDPRAQLVEWLLNSNNEFFGASFSNRVWAHYFGRGIVDPVDDFSVGNPPSNAPLLESLTREFVSHGFDIRHLERTILASRTYQNSSRPGPRNRDDRRNFARAYPRRMLAEVTVDVLNSALGVRDRYEQDAPAGSRAIEVAASSVRNGNLRYVFDVFGRPQRTMNCDCERSVDPSLAQALYVLSDPLVMRKIRGGRLRELIRENGLGDKLRRKTATIDELEKTLEEVWLATLTRPPSTAEMRTAVQYVLRSEDGSESLVDLMWAIINTREFLLNH